MWKTAGPECISIELLKARGTRLLKALRKLINLILQGQELPENLRTGFLTYIYNGEFIEAEFYIEDNCQNSEGLKRREVCYPGGTVQPGLVRTAYLS